MKKMSRVLRAGSIIPLFALLLLTACGGKGDGDIVYVPERVAFTSQLQSVSGSCAIGDTFYLLGQADNRGSGYQLLRLSARGGEAEALPDYRSALPAGGGFALAGTLRAGGDGTLWVMERLLLQTVSEDRKSVSAEEVHILRNLDGDGRELSRFEYGSLEEKLGLGYVFDLLVDGGGDVFAKAEQGAALLDEAGEARFTLEPESRFDSELVRLGDGRIGMTCAAADAPGEFTWSLRTVDKEAGDFGESYSLTAGTPNFANVYDGDGNALFYYKIGDTLKVWREGAEEGEPLANMVDAGIGAYDLNMVSFLPDGRLAIQSGNGWSGSSPVSLDILTAADAGRAQNKKTLTYATLQLTGNQRSAIMDFNRSNAEYRVSITDYSQYGNYEAAMTRLATEIGAGKMPDIIDLYGAPVSRWAANGMLEDLWPWIDGDPELSREDLMERVFQAAEIDGKLFEINRYFWMSTLTGAKSVVGDRMTWTGADMWEALESMPEGCLPTSDSRSTMLRSLMGLDWSRFVDWGEGACDFETEEFKSLLEFCSRFPEDTARLGERGVYEGRQMLLTTAVTGFEFPQRAKFLLGGDIAYVGYPNEWGRTGSSFSFVSSMAMSSACGDKEGAWTFLRTLLLPHDEAEIQRGLYGYFPVNKADFRKAAELAMTPEYRVNEDGICELDDHGGKVEISRNAESFEGIAADCRFYAVTREEYDRLMELYHAIDTYSRWDPGLDPIVTEVAGAYFAGDKSLDETAALIQNRASLYVSEQAG